MKPLKLEEVNAYLTHLGMHIGKWNQIIEIEGQNSEPNWINRAAPEGAQELLNFAYHIADWLPKGDWKLCQIDDSTYLDSVQTRVIERLLFGSDRSKTLRDAESYLFEFGKNSRDDKDAELLLADLIYFFLLFECHVHFVSSNSLSGERLTIQDGFAYFYSREQEIERAKAILTAFEQQPLSAPRWVVDIIANEQK